VATRAREAYVVRVISRHFRVLIHVLVAAQVLLSAPVVAAVTHAPDAAGMSGMPCQDSMPAMADGEPCPCCPDGIDSAASCLSACVAALGSISTMTLPRAITSSSKSIGTSSVPLACAAEPPLKPPPIR
jgi:hypothetical protein